MASDEVELRKKSVVRSFGLCASSQTKGSIRLNSKSNVEQPHDDMSRLPSASDEARTKEATLTRRLLPRFCQSYHRETKMAPRSGCNEGLDVSSAASGMCKLVKSVAGDATVSDGFVYRVQVAP